MSIHNEALLENSEELRKRMLALSPWNFYLLGTHLSREMTKEDGQSQLPAAPRSWVVISCLRDPLKILDLIRVRWFGYRPWIKELKKLGFSTH